VTVVRSEATADFAAVRAVNRAAFEGPVEADLVDRLRADRDLVLSLVAERAGQVVGYCGFSRLRVDVTGKAMPAVSLAPVAVLPVWQRQGIGERMVEEGIARLKALSETLIFVLGAPAFYSRFGFSRSAAAAFHTPYDGPYMQALPLSHDAPVRGHVGYPSAFASL
jgi:putative acetyltransferase